MPAVLVTGAGRGIGRSIALRLAEHGWEVRAGVRRLEDGEQLSEQARGGPVRPVVLDITDPDSVARLGDELGDHLDALVNNAGIVVSGPVEAITAEDLRRQFDVNVVGQVAVTQAVLPQLRRSRGRIVFIGSVSGRLATPMLGPYAASKFAIEAIADSLRVELRPWKIAVSLVEPGSIDTDIWRGALETADDVAAQLSPEHRTLYESHIAGTRKLVGRVQRQTSPPEKVAEAVEHALTARRPRARYLVGADARMQVALGAGLPTSARDAVLARVSGIR